MERGCPGRHPDSLDHVRREARQRIITIRPFGEHLALAQFDGVLPRHPPVATGLLRPIPRCDTRLDEIEDIIGSAVETGGTGGMVSHERGMTRCRDRVWKYVETSVVAG